MPFHQKLLLVIILSVAFTCSAMYAVHEFQTLSNDETSSILRSCGINPINGSSIND